MEGKLALAFKTFTVADDTEQMLGIYTAEPGLPSEGARCEPAGLADSLVVSARPGELLSA